MNKLEMERQYIKSLGELFGDSAGNEKINTIGYLGVDKTFTEMNSFADFCDKNNLYM